MQGIIPFERGLLCCAWDADATLYGDFGRVGAGRRSMTRNNCTQINCAPSAPAPELTASSRDQG